MNLKDYIRGQRQGKEANRMERKAMDDPFLQDAIDGYDSIDGDHISTIEDLEKRLPSPRKQTSKRIWIWAAASVIALLIGIPLLIQKPDMEDNATKLSPDITSRQEKIESSLSKEDTVLLANHQKPDNREEISSEVAQTVSPALPAKETYNKTEEVDEDFEIVKEVTTTEKRDRRPSTRKITDQLPTEEPLKDLKDVSYGSVGERITSRGIQERSLSFRNRATADMDENNIIVSGRIVDEIGEPLVGVSIHSLDRSKGTISDIDGHFQLTVPKDKQETLIASFIGMKDSEIPLKENIGDIEMKSNDMALDEVIVVGFGTQKKESVIGSVTSISPSDLKTPKTDLQNTFAGSVAGVAHKEPLFDKEDFIEYFIESYDKDICAGQKISFKVEFFIDPIGRPAQINIKENSCTVLENEIKRLLLGSPLWSETNRKVTIQVELP